MNKMYTPSPYLFGRMFSHILLQLFSPILMTLILFFGLRTDDSAYTFFGFMICAMEVNLIGCILGYFCGVAFKNSDAARQSGTLSMIVFHLLSGGLSNPAAVNPFIYYLQYVSPNRYSVELFFRVIMFNNNNFSYTGNHQQPINNTCAADPNGCAMSAESALQQVGFTLGKQICYCVLVGFIFLFLILAWFTIVQKNRKFS